MELFNFSYEQFELFILVLIRISSILFLVPFFGSTNIPLQLKIGLSLIFTMILFPTLALEDHIFKSPFSFAFALATEMFIGMIIGYASKLVFAGIQLAGQIMGFQIGFGIVNVYDPSTGGQVSIISQFQHLLALLVFLSMDAHHFIIRAISESYNFVPLFGFTMKGSLLTLIVNLFGSIFPIAVKIAAPITASVLFINVSLAIIAKTVPQMNVFIIGFPLQITMGLIVMGISLPFVFYLTTNMFNHYGKNLIILLKTMG